MFKKNLLLSLFFILFTVLKAQSWEAQATNLLPPGYGVFSVSVVDDMTAWAIAFDQTIGNTIPDDHVSKALRTTDGGLTWESFDIVEAPGRISFDIVAFDKDVAYITTQDFGNGNGRGAFKTEDGGATWNLIYNNISAGVWIRFFNQTEGIVINRQSMAKTSDGGITWTNVPVSEIPAFANDEFTVISSGNNSCVVLGDNIWFGTNKGRIYHSADKGNSWSASSASLGSSALILSVAFRDSLNGIALNANTFYTQFSITNDGGTTWTAKNNNAGISVENLTYIPGTDSSLIATSSQYTNASNRISAYSQDFGETWEVIESNVPYGGTHFAGTNIGWSSRGRVFSETQATMFKWADDFFVDLDNMLLSQTRVYPNPFSHNINIESTQPLQYQLLDAGGRMLTSGNTTRQPSINYLQSLSAGVYYLQLQHGKNQVNYQLIKPQ